MIHLSKEKLLKVIQGSSSGDSFNFVGIEFDSREIKGGEAFVALKGDTTHGHEYVKGAFERGAALFIVEDASLPAKFPEPHRFIVVQDTLKAFWQVANWWREELNIAVLAITGSVGKTTVKEMAASILLNYGRGTYSLKSHNNHVGVPYTICRTSREHSWLVIEMGMNHPGELHQLSLIARPDVALITGIQPAHIGAFSGLEAIALAKLEILDGLREKGTLVLNGSDAILQNLAKTKLKGFTTNFTTSWYGDKVGMDSYVENIEPLGLKGQRFKLHVLAESADINLQVMGRHNALNASAAALAAKLLVPELDMAEIAKGLSKFSAPMMRGQTHATKDGRVIVDDSYNANPASMKATLGVAADFVKAGRKVGLILGDMLELGDFSSKYHTELGADVVALIPTFLITVGEFSKIVSEIVKNHGMTALHANSAEEAASLARAEKFDILFIKASRGIGLDRTVRLLLEGV